MVTGDQTNEPGPEAAGGADEAAAVPVPPAAPALTAEAAEALRAAYLRVQNVAMARRAWDRLLSADERAALGGRFEEAADPARGLAVGMWVRARRVTTFRAVLQLARHLDLMDAAEHLWLDEELRRVEPGGPPARRRPVAPPGAEDVDPAQRIERARTRRLLVLVEGAGHHRAYWRGKRVAAPGAGWGRSPAAWRFLWQLAERAMAGQSLAWDELDGGGSETAVVDRKHRLKQLLPAALHKLIRPGDGAGRYRLGVPADQIDLIELGPEDWLADRGD